MWRRKRPGLRSRSSRRDSRSRSPKCAASSIAGRNTMGVTIFKVADNEHVVSVARIDESEEEEIEAESGDSSLEDVPGFGTF